MEGLYSYILLVICVGQWVLSKIIDVGEEEMRDTPVYKWYLLGSWALLIRYSSLYGPWIGADPIPYGHSYSP